MNGDAIERPSEKISITMRPLTLFPFLPLLATLALSDATALADAPKPAPSATASAGVAEANAFNFAMYGALRDRSGNLFFSAPSLREALGAAYLGARGTTAKEMSSAIHLDPDPRVSGAHAKSELADLAAARGQATLAIANRLWPDQGFAMNPGFARDVMNAYGSPVEPVDFSHHPNDARLAINAWVEKQTNDKIKELLPAPAITGDTRLVITNAIWWKGTWAQAFARSQTTNDPFLVGGTTSKSVPMMHQTASFRLASAEGVKVLEMAYEKSDFALDVVLPDSPAGLGAVEDRLARGQLATWTSGMNAQKVAVSFPKITFSWGGSVKEPLRKLGMKAAFLDGSADLTGIASARAAGGNLYVSDVIHKAFVAIDEQGTEAAASTAVIVGLESAAIERPPVVFKADHPFVFVIRDVKHDRILFMGRVNDPTG